MRKRFIRFVGFAIVALCIAYFVNSLLTNFTALPQLRFSTILTVSIGIATGLVIVVYVLQIWATSLLLLGVGEQPLLREVASIVLLSQLAKYLPGNIGHFVGRVALGEQYGYSRRHLIFTIGYEIGWALVVSAAVAILALLSSGHEFTTGKIPHLPPLWSSGLLVLAVITMPPLGTFVLNRWRPAFIVHLLGDADVKLPPLSVTASCMLLYVAVFCINGLGLAILSEGLIGHGMEHLVLLIGLFSIAWLAGFVVPGAPGGLGVREAILVASLSPLYGEPAAVALSIVSRIVFVLSDGLAFLAGTTIYKLYPPDTPIRECS